MMYRSLLPFLFMQFSISKAGNAESSLVPLILHGTRARIEDFPFFAETEICGASILSKIWLLTAAHCVDSREKLANRLVYVGGDRLDNSIILKYDDIIIHPKYTPKSKTRPLSYDIAVLRLELPLKFSHKLKPVKLPQQVSTANSLVFIARGDDETKQRSRFLMKMEVNKLSDKQCISATKAPDVYRNLFEEHTLICGQKPKRTPGICFGDSGSPLVYNNTILGVASFFFDKECHRANIGYYTNVTTFVPWIKSVTGLRM